MSAISPQGYNYNIAPKSNTPFWAGNAAEAITASATVDDTTGTPTVEVTKTTTDDGANFDFAFSGLKGEKGEQGEQGPQGETGPQGPQGEPGTSGESYNAVVSSTITNENGIYTFTNTMHDGATQEVGTIEVPESDSGIVEVKDSVVENNTDGYDFHTITETQNDGTENEVGKFYLAQKQITIIKSIFPLDYYSVDQTGETTENVVGNESSQGYQYYNQQSLTVDNYYAVFHIDGQTTGTDTPINIEGNVIIGWDTESVDIETHRTGSGVCAFFSPSAPFVYYPAILIVNYVDEDTATPLLYINIISLTTTNIAITGVIQLA